MTRIVVINPGLARYWSAKGWGSYSHSQNIGDKVQSVFHVFNGAAKFSFWGAGGEAG